MLLFIIMQLYIYIYIYILYIYICIYIILYIYIYIYIYIYYINICKYYIDGNNLRKTRRWSIFQNKVIVHVFVLFVYDCICI